MAIPYYFMKEGLTRFPLSDFLVYGAFDDERGVYRLTDGRVGAVWGMPPLTGLGPAAINGLTGLFATDLPPASTIQLAMHASPIIEPALEHYVALRENAGQASTAYRDARRMEEFFLRARETCGFFPRRVKGYELLCLLHQLLNPGHSWADRPVTYDPRQLLKTQAVRLDTKCQLSASSIFLDHHFVKCLTVQPPLRS